MFFVVVVVGWFGLGFCLFVCFFFPLTSKVDFSLLSLNNIFLFVHHILK